MLKNIPPLLGPDLLRHLRAMGHGDELVIADANFPAESNAKHIVRLDAASATETLAAILTLLPLDDFVEEAAACMQVVGAPDQREPIMREFEQIVADADDGAKVGYIERFAFYERAKAAYLIIQTGEQRVYGNILLTKGVVRPD